MKRRVTFLVVTLGMLVSLFPLATDAAGPTHITGGGTGTFDGVHTGSHFGMGVVLLVGGAAQGHFECNMAGNAAVPGLHLMAVSGPVSTYQFNADGSVLLGGVATVNLANGTIFRAVPFTVNVGAGGPGAGTLQLTVAGFDGGPGDTIPANGHLDLPVETVATGGLSLH